MGLLIALVAYRLKPPPKPNPPATTAAKKRPAASSKSRATDKPPEAPYTPTGASAAGERLGVLSPSDAAVADSCAFVRPLWSALDAADDAASCAAFLRDHWERSPLLSRPGATWNRKLMKLGDIARMVGSWPIRFFKNHGTASLHKPNSGFLPDFKWERGQDVPTNILDIAMEEERTLVMHNLEVYWPPIGELIRHVVQYFHAYTQVNLYTSPAGLEVATAPHQDAHSVFIVQVHGRKRWAVHAPLSPWTLKGQQRGKQGEVLSHTDRSVMGPPLLNVTLTPGDVLYIPRAFYHHTGTHPTLLDASDVVEDGHGTTAKDEEDDTMGFGPGDRDRVGPELIGEDQPSMALTISILCEDVFSTWMYLIGEALQELPQDDVDASQRREAEKAVQALKKAAARVEPSGEDEPGARLREALPRAVAARCGKSNAKIFTHAKVDRWRRHVIQLLSDVYASDGRNLPKWLRDSSIDAPLIVALEGVNARKRLPCEAKLNQLVAMRDALGQGKAKDSNPSCASWVAAGECDANPSFMLQECRYGCANRAKGGSAAAAKNEPEKPAVGLTGEALDHIDVDTIFRIEKLDKSYVPQDRGWFASPREW